MIYAEHILICIAIPLIIALLFTGRGTRNFLFSFIMGMITCLLSAYISGFLKFVLNIETEHMAIYYSPVLEEIMKLLPLLFYLFVFNPSDRNLLTAALGLGLGFATFENCCYILSVPSPEIGFVLIRGLAVGVMHFVCAMTLALGLLMAQRLKSLSIPGVVGALALSCAIHGLYNLLVSEPGAPEYFGYMLPMVIVAVLYVLNAKQIRVQ